jgi:hypothetical protein
MDHIDPVTELRRIYIDDSSDCDAAAQLLRRLRRRPDIAEAATRDIEQHSFRSVGLRSDNSARPASDSQPGGPAWKGEIVGAIVVILMIAIVLFV